MRIYLNVENENQIVKGVKTMKKLLVILSVILFIVTSMAAFRDIPKGHWAESYVSRLEQIGIVTGFPDGTFRGDEAVTRYQSALLISRTLDYVELVLKDKQDQINSLLQIVKTLQNTLEASNNELEGKIEELTTQVQDIKLTLELHDQDIIKLYDFVTQIQDKFVYTDEEGNTSEIDLSEIKNDIAGLSEILSGLAAQLGDVDYLLRKQIADLDKKTSAKDDELANSIKELSNKVDELAAQFEMLQAKIDDVNESIANVYDTLSNGILSVQENLTILEAELTARLDELETRILNIESTIETGLPAIRDMVYGLSEDLANAQESMKAYADVLADELNAKFEEHELANNEKFEDLYKTIEEQTATLSEAIMGQQEELALLQEKLDKLNDFVVNFKNEVSEKLENLDMRLSLLEDQVASLTQVVEEVKADKADVEELANKLTEVEKSSATKKELEEVNNKVADVEKSSATKKELEETRTIATWGVVTGVSGIVIGIIALGKVLGWF